MSNVTKSSMHTKFAWFPLTVDSGKRVWLRSVYWRKCRWDSINLQDYHEWVEYFTSEEAEDLRTGDNEYLV